VANFSFSFPSCLHNNPSRALYILPYISGMLKTKFHSDKWRKTRATLPHNVMQQAGIVTVCTRVFPDWVDNEINTRWEATWRVMAAKLTRLAHKMAIQLHLVTETCTIYSSCARRTVRKLLNTPSYTILAPSSRISISVPFLTEKKASTHGLLAVQDENDI
jgi:hypothetical protein